MTVGIPLARGAAASAADLRLESERRTVPLQARAIDHWPDGSVRWALLDFSAEVTDGLVSPLALRIGGEPGVMPAIPVHIEERAGAVHVHTGAAAFALRRGGPFPLCDVVIGGRAAVDASSSGFCVGHRGRALSLAIGEIEVRERGPLRAEIVVRAANADSRLPLDVFARLEFFAGMATARMAITIRNTRRARHPGGVWVLGDPGSLLLDFASLVLTLPADISHVHVAAERGRGLEPAVAPFEIYQDSSGGERWNHRTHVNRHGVVPLNFRGYRMRSTGAERFGFRAAPVVVAGSGPSRLAVAVPEFWQNFPRAINVHAREVEVSFFPRQFGDVHELQGGEQKTHVVAIAFGEDVVSDPPLAWCHDPVRLFPDADYCCATGVVPFLRPAAHDDDGYRALVGLALDDEHGFFAKRERFDEYGWRHFGDLPGDHESAFQPVDDPFVSHYNNQYDAVAAFAMHFLKSGDARWWRLMDDLARHVVDIDIYHTREDKAAYNGGLFWHTQHYMDAGTSTHRTYPRGSGGGGPSAEHNYNAGLMLHYLLTGNLASRDAAIGLGRWVIDMDDGRLTPFRWLASGPTGLASATGSMAYHGPGRGPANSIRACLVALQLTGDSVFADKADELIRRCIHPEDDLEARNLFDVERRWYYTVFLQALAVYLDDKAQRNEIDEMYAYARTSLVRYARWMADHERPYLDRADRLEYPTETWVAQDIRKAEVLLIAGVHVGGLERSSFFQRAAFFADYVVTTLRGSATRHFTRPLVIVLAHAPVAGAMQRTPDAESAFAMDSGFAPRPPHPFEPQKLIARRHATYVGATVVATVVVFGIALVLW